MGVGAIELSLKHCSRNGTMFSELKWRQSYPNLFCGALFSGSWQVIVVMIIEVTARARIRADTYI